MNRLPPEIILMIARVCKISSLATLCRCSKYFSDLSTPILYAKDIASTRPLSIAFALQLENEDVSVPILRKAKAANANLETQHSITLLDPTPRHYDIFFRGFKTFKYHRSTLLGIAISRGLDQTVNFLLDGGAHIDAIVDREINHLDVLGEPRLWTPLFIALTTRNRHVAMKLLDRGASLDALGSGLNALHIAAAANLPELIQRFSKEYPFDANIQDVNGDTALAYAIYSPYSDVALLSLLVRLGANVNFLIVYHGQHISPLSIACMSGRWDLAIELLHRGADATGCREVMVDGSGPGPLHPLRSACSRDIYHKAEVGTKRRTLIEALLNQGADPNRQGHTGEPLIVELVRKKLGTCLQYLLQDGRLYIEQTDAQGKTALAWALSTEHGAPDLGALLLKHRANVPSSSAQTILKFVHDIWNARMPMDIWNLLSHHKTLYLVE
ncbi:ankyrin repeat-containing domain protein [Truncatella angustata]|uniref:Ankyrin repeat-containing domain protein n=1 Tax=Truncatella angustata TaxID=152316 RepID=A0A9P8UU80_9PEZI|nr:ankyrin repeat-containing domain protein [Truncatella angustata]KAH6658602.1 ankyrin repeat-containing domain protein [Truncatella angustata]